MFFKSTEKKIFGTRPALENHAQQGGNANLMLKELIVTITALHDILVRENETLDLSNSRAFFDLQDEKLAVARKYEELMVALKSHQDIASVDPKLKSQLLSMEDGFSSVMKTNMQKLERMKSSTEKLGDMIMKAARKSAETVGQFAYGAAGTMQKGVKSTIGISEQA